MCGQTYEPTRIKAEKDLVAIKYCACFSITVRSTQSSFFPIFFLNAKVFRVMRIGYDDLVVAFYICNALIRSA